jgi:hypothetical protein
MHRCTSQLPKEPPAKIVTPSRQIDLSEEFRRAAGNDGRGESHDSTGTTDRGALRPASEARILRGRPDVVREFNDAAADPGNAGGGDSSSRGPRDPTPEEKEPRRRRRRRDIDRGR